MLCLTGILFVEVQCTIKPCYDTTLEALKLSILDLPPKLQDKKCVLEAAALRPGLLLPPSCFGLSYAFPAASTCGLFAA